MSDEAETAATPATPEPIRVALSQGHQAQLAELRAEAQVILQRQAMEQSHIRDIERAVCAAIVIGADVRIGDGAGVRIEITPDALLVTLSGAG